MLNKLKLLSIVSFTFFCFSNPVFAANPIYTSVFSDLALKGYDAVSYFQSDGVPVKGSKSFQTEWRGATWRFSTQANLSAFLESPEKFAPQYGGYCAFAAADGKLAKGDPLVYSKIGDKLYLNFNKKIHRKWEENQDEFIQSADDKFPDLVESN